MSQLPGITIGKVLGNVHNAGSMIFNNGVASEQKSHSAEGSSGPVSALAECQTNSLAYDGSSSHWSNSPAQSDNTNDESREDNLPGPVQVADSSSPSRDESETNTGNRDLLQRPSTPVAVQVSSDYFTAGGENVNGPSQGGFNDSTVAPPLTARGVVDGSRDSDASHAGRTSQGTVHDRTALAELKTVNGMDESRDSDTTQGHGRPDSLDGNPTHLTQLNEAAANASPTEMTELKLVDHVNQNTSSDPSLAIDGPEPDLSLSPSSFVPPTSLQMDRGGENPTLQSETECEVFVVLNKEEVLQDVEEPTILVVDFRPSEDILKNAEETGSFAVGSSKLMQLKWLGYFDFYLTRWKLSLKPDVADTSQLNYLTRHLCNHLLELEVKCLRSMMKQLKQTHSIFLHSLLWENGLCFYLGHADSDQQTQRIQVPTREQVQGVLMQLLPEWALDLLGWEEPVRIIEEEKEDGGLSVPPFNSVDTEDSFRSRRSNDSSDEDSNSHSLQQLSLTGSGLSAQSASANNSDIDALKRFFEERLEEKLQQTQQESGKQLQQQQEKLHTEMDSVKQIAAGLQREFQNFKDTRRQWQEEKEDARQEMDARFQDQTKVVTELSSKLQQDKAAAQDKMKQDHQKLMEDMQQNQAKMMEEMKRLHQQEQMKMAEEMKKVMEDLQEKDTRFQVAQEDMRYWCASFEQRGQRSLNGAVQLVREMGLQNRELAVQKDKHFKSEIMAYVGEWEHRIKKRLEGYHAQVLQHEMKQKGELQAWLMEFHKIRKELQEDRLYPQLPDAASAFVGMAQQEEDLGAVGGSTIVMRNQFQTALTESEQTTSKMKGTDEEKSSNQLEDRMRLPEIDRACYDSAEKSGPTMVVVAPVPEDEPVPGETPAANGSPVQSGARSKKLQQQQGQSGSSRGSRSPSAGRKLDTVREDSQESTPGAPPQESKGDTEEDLTRAEQFLDWISIRGNLTSSKDMARIISKNVNAALKEEENPAPRAKCLDTILCLDVSESIVRDGYLDTVKKTALDFVDGIEDLMDEMDLEENLAVVAVGGNARVVQHLTNDLTLVREAIESLDDRGGRTPFMQALLVCLAANKGRGGIVNVSGVYKVRPRIIFITDGCPTDESLETGPDIQSNLHQTKFSLVQLLSQLASKKHRTTPRPISWVPVGRKPDEQFLQSITSLSDGELVMPTEIRRLCRYYKVQQTIGRLFKMVKNKDQEFITDDRMRELLVAIASSTITEAEKEHILDAVKKLQEAPAEQEEPEADDFTNVFEDEEKVKNGELLALGTRVVRGPDWKWKNQDTDGPGTVIQHSKKDNWIYVKWDNGTYNAYRYNEDDKSDIVETQHHPRQIPLDSATLSFGVRVVRGPDWKGDNQDGKGPGTVIRCQESDGRVKVRWDKTSKICEHFYSLTKGKEVQIDMPEFPRNVHTDNQDMAQDVRSNDNDDNKTIPMWKWRDDQRQWRLYDEEIAEKLESEFQKRPTASCVVPRAGRNRRVSFKQMQEKTVDDGATTEVLREMVDEDRKNDLLAIELSLQDP